MYLRIIFNESLFQFFVRYKSYLHYDELTIIYCDETNCMKKWKKCDNNFSLTACDFYLILDYEESNLNIELSEVDEIKKLESLRLIKICKKIEKPNILHSSMNQEYYYTLVLSLDYL